MAPDLGQDQLRFLKVHTVIGTLYHKQLGIGHFGGDELGVVCTNTSVSLTRQSGDSETHLGGRSSPGRRQ